ncbi:hypothetical protein D9M70_521010 [compost metagenome]
MRRIYVKAIIRVLLQHALGAFSELVGILAEVLRADGEQRLLIRERVGAEAWILGVEAGRGLHRAGIGGNAAVRVTGLDCAPRSKARPQLLGLLGRHRCMRIAGRERHQGGSDGKALNSWLHNKVTS